MIEVAAGILFDTQGRVLLMQRLPGKHLAGLWEFPGGKLEPGETVEQALTRELREELGVEVRACVPLISIPWRYPEKAVRLHALRVSAWHGEPQAREGHPLRWTAVRNMDVAVMPPADAPIVTALRLPSQYIITDTRHPGPSTSSGQAGLRPNRDPAPLVQFGDMEIDGGPKSATRIHVAGCKSSVSSPMLQLRMPDAPREIVRQTAVTWLAAEPSLRDRLLINHDIDLARELGVGVHLRAVQLRTLHERPLPADAWVGASCHDAEELELAARLKVDFATLSPVCTTTSHSGATPLGWEAFARLVADARLPIYALGGVGPNDLATARAASAQGVAGIRAFADHPLRNEGRR